MTILNGTHLSARVDGETRQPGTDRVGCSHIMPYIDYRPDEKRVEIQADETILDVSLREGIVHAHACGGKARCSTCRVVILQGIEHCCPRNEKEKSLAARLHFSPTMRLACQTRITGDVELRRPVLDDIDIQLTNQIRSGAHDHAGEEKQIAILFADIVQYTPFAEALPPYDVVHILNRYFYLMGQVIVQNGGIISDYVGDGLMAIFGVEDPTDTALRAVKTGIEMREAVEKLNPYLEGMYGRGFQIRIGVHFGEVVIGSIGIAGMTKVAAIGDAVNFASRVETANKQTGTNFLISEETYLQVEKQVSVKQSFRLPLKGKSGEYVLYEVERLRDTDE